MNLKIVIIINLVIILKKITQKIPFPGENVLLTHPFPLSTP